MNNLNGEINTLMAQCIRSNSTNSHIDQFANNENCLPQTHRAPTKADMRRGVQHNRKDWPTYESAFVSAAPHMPLNAERHEPARMKCWIVCLEKTCQAKLNDSHTVSSCVHSFYTLLEIRINCRSIVGNNSFRIEIAQITRGAANTASPLRLNEA